MNGIHYYFQKCNISAVKDCKTAVAAALPILILPLLNLVPLFSQGLVALRPVTFRAVLFTLLWATVEETVFRGILPAAATAYLKLSAVCSAFAVSAIFAVFHLAGIIKGAELSYSAVQTVFAFGAGFLFASLTFLCKSILPSAAIHFLLNLSADICSGNDLPMIIWCLAAVLCVIYGIYLFGLEKRSSVHEAIY